MPVRARFNALVFALAFVTVMPTMAGCASQVLVGPTDPVFAEAQQRLEATTSRVEALSVPPEERTLFLQGEAFFRYRFASPSRGTLSYLGELGAAATDFPALQSLAGSLDLLDLRLRAVDAALQLWETLLSRRPTTALRPLTLYRLGWAYPSSDLVGLPRDSGEEAFATLIAEHPGTPLALLAAQAEAVPMKRKGTAAAWSLVPGFGQFYVGEYPSGSIRVGITLTALAAIVVPIYVGYERRSNLTWEHDWPLLAASVGGLIVLSFNYTASYEEAMRGVVEWNERAEAAFERAHPDAP